MKSTSHRTSVAPLRLGLPALLLTAALAFVGCNKAAPAVVPKPVAAKKVAPKPAKPAGFVYPKARRGDTAEAYHGTRVTDPYRWLEDPDSQETRAWIDAQNKLTHPYLAAIPAREKIRQRLQKLWNYERFSVPSRKGKSYFYERNDGLQNQAVLYVTDDLARAGRVLLDPNTLSKDGTVAMKHATVSDDGKLVAYQLSASGSDWVDIKILDIATGKDLPDLVKWVKFSGVAWRKDGSGFFYSRYDAPKKGEKLRQANYFHKLYWHKVGTAQQDDVLIYERKDHKNWGFGGGVTDDDRYLIIHVWRGAQPRNQVFIKDLRKPKKKVVELLTGFDNEYDFIGNDKTTFYFKTDRGAGAKGSADEGAPRKRVVAIDIRKPAVSKWREIVPESKDTIRGVRLFGKRLLVNYMHDAKTRVAWFTLKGKADGEIKLPGIGAARGFSGKRKHTETFYSFAGFTSPTEIWRHDIKTGKSTIFRKPKVAFDPAGFVTKQVFFKSKDGTRVPMFVAHRKGLKLDGNNPTYLHGYGGFNVSITPHFKVARLVWMQLGGVFAYPNLRGGGEYGEQWHQDGMLGKKQNVFDDFIAAAQFLIDNRYTNSKKLAIGGGSNGGLLVGACMTQRPELYAAGLAAVGVMDMLRYHKWTIGWAWVPEYGSSAKPDAFKWLYAYSPLHNLKPAKYPATLVTTADHDDRVVPAHSFKFAAQLQHVHKGDAPVMIRIETKAGHGAGKPTSKRIEEAADRWAFLFKNLGMTLPAGF